MPFKYYYWVHQRFKIHHCTAQNVCLALAECLSEKQYLPTYQHAQDSVKPTPEPARHKQHRELYGEWQKVLENINEQRICSHVTGARTNQCVDWYQNMERGSQLSCTLTSWNVTQETRKFRLQCKIEQHWGPLWFGELTRHKQYALALEESSLEYVSQDIATRALRQLGSC